MQLLFLWSIMAALATSQRITSTPTTTDAPLNPTPDALDLDGIRNIPEPVYTIIEGLSEFDVPYEPEAALATAAVEVSETPLTVFPAATTAAINAAGESA